MTNEEADLLRTLNRSLKSTQRTQSSIAFLIFVNQETADNLLRELMGEGYLCMSLHGGKDQVDRDLTIADFKAGVVPIVIATSVAAWGLDVKQLKLVIDFDAPNHMDYIHHAGRKSRKQGRLRYFYYT